VDGVEDAVDNCVFIPNGPLAGADDQADTDGNGIGDACQCGDVNQDGVTNVTDALRIARGEVLSSDPGEPSCDVNGDGVCNVTDALAIARGEVSSAPAEQRCPGYNVCEVFPQTATFDATGMTVDEGAGEVALPLFLDAPIQGTVRYTVSGTAGPGDFEPLSGTVAIDGDTVVIPISITDDSELEPIEWITLTLAPCHNVASGRIAEFQLRIRDNDTFWEGSFKGPPATPISFDFRLHVTQSASGPEVGLIGDDAGLIPPGGYGAGGALVFNDRTVQIHISSVGIDGESVGFGGPLTLSLLLKADEFEHTITETSIEGDGFLLLSIQNGDPALDRLIEGTFSLARRATPPSLAEVELLDLGP
jgi:hypothetical protein